MSEYILYIESVCKSFGGLLAVNGLDLAIPKGSVSSVIGPNGAGKTTLFNMITGYVMPDSGVITFNDISTKGLKPHQIASLGIAKLCEQARQFRAGFRIALHTQAAFQIIPGLAPQTGLQA